MRKFSTSTKFDKERYPRLAVYWQEDDDQHGFKGEIIIWKDGDTKECKHEIHIRQTAPLGEIFVDLDSVVYGAWDTATFEGVRLDERDLQWATQWAKLSIKRKHQAIGNNLCQLRLDEEESALSTRAVETA